MKEIEIAPSMLSANFARIAEEIKKVENSGAKVVHLDVMDGSFVPQISFGQKMISDMRTLTKLVFDVHLMTVDPEHHISTMIESGANILTFQYEAVQQVWRVVDAIKNAGIDVGIALCPATPISMLEDVLPDLDRVLIMGVNPGYGGQQIKPAMIEKVRRLDLIRKERNLDLCISFDGGVTGKNASVLKEAGVDSLVTGSAFFKAEDPKLFLENMRGV